MLRKRTNKPLKETKKRKNTKGIIIRTLTRRERKRRERERKKKKKRNSFFLQLLLTKYPAFLGLEREKERSLC